MSTDTTADHLRRPHIRRIQPIPVTSPDGKRMVALRDPTMLAPRTMVVPPQVLSAIQLMQGKLEIPQIAEQVKVEPEQVESLVKALDELGLLWGPMFERLEKELLEKLEEHGAYPIRAAGTLGKTPEECRAAIDGWFAETEDPELERAVTGIVAPHLDYARGWPNYAAAYYGWRSAPKPDRVVVLGTNHFGTGDGVVGTKFSFTTPLGTCPVDGAVLAALESSLGRPYLVDQLDHFGEHSIDLQIPWIQACFGDVPIVPALVPDPLVGLMTEAEGERIDGAAFIEALAAALASAGGTTYFVASADLSHVGPQFGEPRPVDDQRRIDVERHDREMMAKFLAGDAKDFVEAMRWNKNPTRWCSIGNMTAFLELVGGDASFELIDYRQAVDPRGLALVSASAMVAMREQA